MTDVLLQVPAESGVEFEELLSAAEWQKLTRHFCQARIAYLLCAGCSQAQMAERAQLSINTVRMHLRGLFARMEAHDRVGVLVRILLARRSMAESGRASAIC
jgi:DNA-binding CsgD family transcriptional regulator